MSFRRHQFNPTDVITPFENDNRVIRHAPRAPSTGRVIRHASPIPHSTIRDSAVRPVIQRSLSPRVSHQRSYIVERPVPAPVRVVAQPAPVVRSVVRVQPPPPPVRVSIPAPAPVPAPAPAPVQNSTLVVDDEERYRTVASDYKGYGRHKTGDRPGNRVHTYNNRFNRNVKPYIVDTKGNGGEYRDDSGCQLI